MDKEIFKKGDTVYHTDFGWGVIKDIDNCDDAYPLQISYNNGSVNYFPCKSVSFTEYTLQGFTQERPIVLPEVGELCLVRNYGGLNWHVATFREYKNQECICSQEHRWDEFKRIKILD